MNVSKYVLCSLVSVSCSLSVCGSHDTNPLVQKVAGAAFKMFAVLGGGKAVYDFFALRIPKKSEDTVPLLVRLTPQGAQTKHATDAAYIDDLENRVVGLETACAQSVTQAALNELNYVSREEFGEQVKKIAQIRRTPESLRKTYETDENFFTTLHTQVADVANKSAQWVTQEAITQAGYTTQNYVDTALNACAKIETVNNQITFLRTGFQQSQQELLEKALNPLGTQQAEQQGKLEKLHATLAELSNNYESLKSRIDSGEQTVNSLITRVATAEQQSVKSIADNMQNSFFSDKPAAGETPATEQQ